MVDDADKGLVGRQAAGNFLPEGFFFDVVDKFFYNRQGYVRFEQGKADFPQRLFDVVFCQFCLTADIFENFTKAVG